MDKKIFTQKLCTAVGEQVRPWRMTFSVDIRDKLFFWQSRSNAHPEVVVRKELNQGLFISGENTVVLEGFIEFRNPGHHTAYMVCEDQDGPNAIFKWEIEINEKRY